MPSAFVDTRTISQACGGFLNCEEACLRCLACSYDRRRALRGADNLSPERVTIASSPRASYFGNGESLIGCLLRGLSWDKTGVDSVLRPTRDLRILSGGVCKGKIDVA